MFKIPELQKFDHLVHAISTTADGNLSFKFGEKETVIKNREKLLKKVDIPIDRTVCIQVKHSNEALMADEKLAGISMREGDVTIPCDGLVTNQKDLYLFLLIADCIPVILYDPLKKAIGLAHCGWDELDLGIIESIVNSFSLNYKSNPKDLICAIGPAIRKDSYIQTSPSQKDDPKWTDFVEPIGGEKYKVDIVGFCKDRLIKCGVESKNIFDTGIDTAIDERFFSHYRDKKNGVTDKGRFACVVGMK